MLLKIKNRSRHPFGWSHTLHSLISAHTRTALGQTTLLHHLHGVCINSAYIHNTVDLTNMHAGHSIGYGTVDYSELATVQVQILQTTIQLLVYWHRPQNLTYRPSTAT